MTARILSTLLPPNVTRGERQQVSVADADAGRKLGLPGSVPMCSDVGVLQATSQATSREVTIILHGITLMRRGPSLMQPQEALARWRNGWRPHSLPLDRSAHATCPVNARSVASAITLSNHPPAPAQAVIRAACEARTSPAIASSVFNHAH
ncbi:hypothetical protein NDU88_008491 [Pleurodeles waltl]|uniref:Uncharacterized protein n=1 Tax=Pleurodeles waltl TaxID=8319 RepID=A0AAV7QQU8_PLEWA|nr:hypothetical protein NDU88_008491 [Pleurodeles waltl]